MRRVPVRRKQAEFHLGRIGRRDAIRLLIINSEVVNLEVMKRIHLDGTDGNGHAQCIAGNSRSSLLYLVHESAGLYVIPDTAQYQRQYAQKHTDAYPDGFSFHDSLPNDSLLNLTL